MKHSISITIVLFTIWASSQCFGQDQLLWKSSLENDSEDVFKDNYNRIAKGGFQLGLEEFSTGKVLVRFDDLALLASNILGGSDGLEFSYQSVSNKASAVFIGRNAIREQLRGQFQDNLAPKMSAMRFRGSSDNFKKEPAIEAYDVLRRKDWKEPLKGEALNYYVNLIDIVAKDKDDRMDILKTRYPPDVWNSFFTGKYSIYTQPSQ